MIVTSHFEIKAHIYFRVYDAEINGGKGSVGYVKQSFLLSPAAELSAFDDTVAKACRINIAKVLNVSQEKIEFISSKEYEERSKTGTRCICIES